MANVVRDSVKTFRLKASVQYLSGRPECHRRDIMDFEAYPYMRNGMKDLKTVELDLVADHTHTRSIRRASSRRLPEARRGLIGGS